MGQEIELDERLDQLHRAARESETAVDQVLEQVSDPVQSREVQSRLDTAQDIEAHIIEESARSPRSALMALSAELERYVRHAMVEMGQQPGTHLRGSLNILASRGSLSPSVASQFTTVRNEIVHGRYQASDDEILRAIDSGLMILRAVAAIPRESHYVKAVEVPLFEDAEGARRRGDCVGLILRSVSPGKAISSTRIFPTTGNGLKVGDRVSWKWGT